MLATEGNFVLDFTVAKCPYDDRNAIIKQVLIEIIVLWGAEALYLISSIYSLQYDVRYKLYRWVVYDALMLMIRLFFGYILFLGLPLFTKPDQLAANKELTNVMTNYLKWRQIGLYLKPFVCVVEIIALLSIYIFFYTFSEVFKAGLNRIILSSVGIIVWLIVVFVFFSKQAPVLAEAAASLENRGGDPEAAKGDAEKKGFADGKYSVPGF